MREWRELVRQRLGPLGLEAGREEEIIRELANHLEESLEGRCESGPAMEEEYARTLDAVDWAVAQHEIRRAELEEGGMNYRTRTVWLPGLLTSTLSMSLMWVLLALGGHMRFPWSGNPAMMFFPSRTLALPIIGAAGALISRRLGGRPRASVLAGLFPSATMCAVFVVAAPIALLLNIHGPKILLLQGIAGAMFAWVTIPGAALLVGALPVAIARRHEPTPSSVHA